MAPPRTQHNNPQRYTRHTLRRYRTATSPSQSALRRRHRYRIGALLNSWEELVRVFDLSDHNGVFVGRLLLNPWEELVRAFDLLDDDGGISNDRLSEETIFQNMKVRNIIKLDGDDEDDDEEVCVVCRDDLYRQGKENVVPILDNCGHHQFHAECMKKWLMHKNTCPLCKATGLNLDQD